MDKRVKTKEEQEFFYWHLTTALLSGHTYSYANKLARDSIGVLRKIKDGSFK